MCNKIFFSFLLIGFFFLVPRSSFSQCAGGIMEPGFAFLTSSRGCAPFTVKLQTLYLSSVAGTEYFIDWGDGTPEQSFIQTNATGVTITHTYPVASVDCGYDLVIDASNACNPRGSVVPINTQVIVWTKDVVSITPQTIRVCQGVAANLSFTDGSAWNCFPRATRENSEPRWVQWIYGTGPLINQIPGIKVNNVLPGAFPYLNPAALANPLYPVLAPGQISLSMSVPATTVADIGKEFVVTLKNWNQCNPYDDNVLDGNGRNPVNGDLINGDNPAQVATARIVIVPLPQPTFVTRLGNSGGPIQTTFCIGDAIFFDDNTPSISGASFKYTWQFFDNSTGAGTPLSTTTSANPTYSYPTGGQKLIRLAVKDANATGNCVNTFEVVITISPSLAAKIGVTDLTNNPITPFFCQEAAAPFTTFQARFIDASVGTVTASTEWRWEFYNESNVLVRQEPSVGFSSVALGPFDQPYSSKGIYKVVLRIRDNVTGCETTDVVQVRVYEKPAPAFAAGRVCEGNLTSFAESSTVNAINGESISLREWDFNYDGVAFNKDAAFDNRTSFTRSLGAGGTYQVALRVTTDQNSCAGLLVIPVRVDPLPIARFTPSVSSGCGPLTVTFTNNSVTGQPDVIDRFVWEVDAHGGLGFQPIATQHPTDPGFSPLFVNKFQNNTTSNKLYDIRLRVFTVNNCEALATAQVITVFPGTLSGFSELNYSPFNSNCSPVSVNFKADSQTQSLNPTDYQWKISDANGIVSQTSTGTNPAFNFSFSNLTNSFKDFSVNLVATLSSGCSGDSTRTIRVSPVPTSLFIIDTLQFDCQQVKVRLTAIQKGLPFYHWVITENAIPVLNTTSAEDQLERIFTRPASSAADLPVQFSLDTKNFANCASPVSSTSIVVPKQENINASFTATPATQTLPNSTVTINNNTNTGPWQYLWDFGDQTASTDPSITSHTFATYGTYTISLTVTSKYCEEKAVQTITILAIPPVVDFSYDPPNGCVSLRVDFTNLSKYADESTYRWDFGDGTTPSQEVNPMHVYGRAGTYTVTLSASNSTGQRVTETKQRIIQVYPRPKASFDVKPTLLYIPGGILYTSNLSFDASTFAWDFGDNTFSSDPQPEHRYTNEGTYTIRLKAFNQFGCADSTKLENVVKVQKGGQVLVPNAFSPNLSGSIGSVGGGGSMSDGKNDVFLPVMRGITQFELLIFDRWGELLFESRDPARGWDGYFNGKLCQQDVYMYKLTASFETGETVVRVGDVNLIR
jgi:gliding motility-associated-like protein